MISLALSLRNLCLTTAMRLSRAAALVAWRWLLSPRDYILLHDLVIDTQDGPARFDFVVVSRRGVFPIEDRRPLQADSPPAATEEAGYCDTWSKVVAGAIDEDSALVSPIVVCRRRALSDHRAHAHRVSDLGLVQYIRSFKVDVFSERRVQQIAHQLTARTEAALAPAAAAAAASKS